MAKLTRVRLAPSPTGDVHIGTIWIAQFNWLFAKQQQGKFIVRLEDTDQKRLVPDSVQKIYEALDWYGLTPDEGPQQGGPYAPYIQSQRLEKYRAAAKQLLQQGSAYYCFCSPQRLEELREQQAAAKLPPRYDKRCASIPASEAAQRVAAGESAVIRLNVPLTGSVTLEDIIRGQVTFQYAQVDDSVLMKSDGFPTYHLAVVVDDHQMEISHVIRGEEWLSSAPKHLYLYQALGWEPPVYAHLPLILGTDKKKLSKRHGATSALQFRDQGYLPEAMNNFLALMGWHPKGDIETLTRAELLQQFRLADINPSGAVFDQTKLDWMNGWYIRHLPDTTLLEKLKPFWRLAQTHQAAPDQHIGLLRLVQDRLTRLDQIDELTRFGFSQAWDEDLVKFNRTTLDPKKKSAEAAAPTLLWFKDWLSNYASEWSASAIKPLAIAAIADHQLKNKDVLWPARVALTLRTASPDVFDVLGFLGQAESLRRLQACL